MTAMSNRGIGGAAAKQTITATINLVDPHKSFSVEVRSPFLKNFNSRNRIRPNSRAATTVAAASATCSWRAETRCGRPTSGSLYRQGTIALCEITLVSESVDYLSVIEEV